MPQNDTQILVAARRYARARQLRLAAQRKLKATTRPTVPQSADVAIVNHYLVTSQMHSLAQIAVDAARKAELKAKRELLRVVEASGADVDDVLEVPAVQRLEVDVWRALP